MLSEKLWVFMAVVEDVWTQKSQDHRSERGFASELIDVADSLSFAMSRYIQIIPTLLWAALLSISQPLGCNNGDISSHAS